MWEAGAGWRGGQRCWGRHVCGSSLCRPEQIACKQQGGPRAQQAACPADLDEAVTLLLHLLHRCAWSWWATCWRSCAMPRTLPTSRRTWPPVRRPTVLPCVVFGAALQLCARVWSPRCSTNTAAVGSLRRCLVRCCSSGPTAGGRTSAADCAACPPSLLPSSPAANIFIGSLIFIEELADKIVQAVAPCRDSLDACLIFPSMPAVMKLNKLGSFSMSQLGERSCVCSCAVVQHVVQGGGQAGRLVWLG